MTAIKSVHSRVFEKLVADHQRLLVESLVSGVPNDYATYRQMVGRIEGIREALSLSEEADFKISGDEQSDGA
jgi:hypothetical protein